jgi:RNA-binding protein
MLSSQQKRSLRREAQTIKPLIRIGKKGVTPETIDNINLKLDDHELVKVKYNSNKEQKQELSAIIAEGTHSTIIDIIGNTTTLYRPSSDPEKRRVKP